jgi:predicted Mrr-cat superfamily restriction endonuclease
MRDGGFVAVGFPLRKDLTNLIRRPNDLDAQIKAVYPHSSTRHINATLTQLVLGIKDGDIVVVADGLRNLGIGRITGDYQYDASLAEALSVRRNVTWLRGLHGMRPSGRIARSPRAIAARYTNCIRT